MPERTDIEKKVRRLIAADRTYRLLNNLGQKGVRNLNKRASEIDNLIKEKEKIGKRILVAVKQESESKYARSIRDAVDIFKKRHSKLGSELEKLISETREARSIFLTYSLKPDFNLSESDYVEVMKDLGFEEREAASMYPHILSIADRLKKPDEYVERKILIG
ncbi:MAG: hypothetical protein KKF48_00925 [Nanoarchaeota archaeon]|nr:hypothetical protein [Nanoarchaeota archaeon]MBU1027586.1 hypothetical protein [Nanoarchaeota archaeon]